MKRLIATLAAACTLAAAPVSADSWDSLSAMIAEMARVQEMNQRDAHEAAHHCSLANARTAIGMSDHEVAEAWCPPDHVNTTTTRNALHEQWVYPEARSRRERDRYITDGGHIYLYFDDGILTAIQRRR